MIKTFLARYLGLIILAASKDVSLSNRLHYFLEALGKTAVQAMCLIYPTSKVAEKKFNQLLYTVLSALGLVALIFIIKIIRK